MTTAKQKKHYTNWLEAECEKIFRWAGYVPHTLFHRNRYPLIGDYYAWARLEDRLNFQRKGRIPDENLDQDKQHVLDIIIYSNQNRNKVDLVRTDMHTIVLWHPSSYKINFSDEQEWINRLQFIDGSIASIDFEKTMDDMASDFEREIAIEGPALNIDRILGVTNTPSVSKPEISLKAVKLTETIRSNQPKKVDELSVLFGGDGGLSKIISSYQEDRIKKIMIKCGAIVYNRELLSDDPPDGYYLCDAECIDCLKQYFHNSTQIFATKYVFHSPNKGTYILLTVEAKLSMACLQNVLIKKKNYYIFKQTPKPIRHLIIMDGGIESRTWMFLFNLINICSPDRNTSIEERIYTVSRELAEQLKLSSTHVIHLPHFSSETFRQVPLTKSGLKFLHELYKAWQNLKTCSKKTGEITSYKRIFRRLDAYVSKNPVKEPRSKINDSILLDPATRENCRLLNFLEQLALSFFYEIYRKTEQINNDANIPMPKWIKEHVNHVRTSRQKRIATQPAKIEQCQDLDNNMNAGGTDSDVTVTQIFADETWNKYPDISSSIVTTPVNITEPERN